MLVVYGSSHSAPATSSLHYQFHIFYVLETVALHQLDMLSSTIIYTLMMRPFRKRVETNVLNENKALIHSHKRVRGNEKSGNSKILAFPVVQGILDSWREKTSMHFLNSTD